MKTFHYFRAWLTAVVLLLSLSSQAALVTITVTSGADSGPNTLRWAAAQAVTAANNGDIVTIELQVPTNPSAYITLNSPVSFTGVTSGAIAIENPVPFFPQIIRTGNSWSGGSLLEMSGNGLIMGCQNVIFQGGATGYPNGVEVSGTAHFVFNTCNFSSLRDGITSSATNELNINTTGFQGCATGVYHNAAGSSIVGPIDFEMDNCSFFGCNYGVRVHTVAQLGLVENVTISNSDICATRGIHIENYGLDLNKDVTIVGNNFDCDDFVNVEVNVYLASPLQHWVVENNDFHKRYAGSSHAIFLDRFWEIVTNQALLPYGLDFITSTNTFGLPADNGTNRFHQYIAADHYDFMVRGAWPQNAGVHIAGYDLEAGVRVRQGEHTKIRDNKIGPWNPQDMPIALEANGNQELPKIIFTSAVQQGANSVIGYDLPPGISAGAGPYIVDFYEADANGGLIKWLDADPLGIVSGPSSHTHTITAPVNTNNRLAATITSLGTGSLTRLGTSEVEYFCYQPVWSYDPGCLGDPIQFNSNLPNVSAYPRYWNFGDPNSGSANVTSQANPTHVFVGDGTNNPQTFTVSLTVYGPYCGSYTETQSITFQGYPAPTFTYNSACNPDPWQFYVTGVGGGAGATISWDFGDPNSAPNNTSTANTPTHQFVGNGNQTPQSFPVTLSATNSCGTVSTSQLITASWPPVALFTAVEACIGEDVDFTNMSQNTGSGTQFLWNFGDPNSGGFNLSTATNPTHEFVGLPGATYTQAFVVTLTVTNPNCPSKVYTRKLFICPPTCCNSVFPVQGIDQQQLDELGEFYLDYNTGQFGFQSLSCPAEYPMDCFTSGTKVLSLDSALSASASVLTEFWEEEDGEYFSRDRIYPLPASGQAIYANANEFELGHRGNFRMKRAYGYRVPIDQLPHQTVNRTRGPFELDFFRWEDDGNFNDANKWLLETETAEYDGNGRPIADHNILDVYSTSKYGYNSTLPTLVAQNAEDHTVEFRSFENLNPLTSALDDGLPFDYVNGTRSVVHSHTGKHSVELHTFNSADAFRFAEITNSEQVLVGGLMVRTWVWIDKNAPDISTQLKVYMKEEGNSTWSNNVATMEQIAAAGEWALFEGIIPANFIQGQIQIGTILQFGLNLDMSGYAAGDVFVDDVRLQPIESEMVCYVYDNAQRLTHVLDDQHFASGFQYNAEGQLIRKLKETERGWKTLSESHYNSVGSDRK